MGTNDFVSFKPLPGNLYKCQKDITGKQVDFHKASSFNFTGGHKVHIKYTYEDRGWKRKTPPLVLVQVYLVKYQTVKAMKRKICKTSSLPFEVCSTCSS
jgi:hypothetical protein